MAVVAIASPMIGSKPGQQSKSVTWANLGNGDTGEPFDVDGGCSTFSDKSVQVVVNAAGVGDTVVIQGSNDGTNYETLTDNLGNALSFTAAGLKFITENVGYIRPNVTAGDGTTDITVVIVGRV